MSNGLKIFIKFCNFYGFCVLCIEVWIILVSLVSLEGGVVY